MKQDEKKRRFRKQRSVKAGSLTAKVGPTLGEFWAELQRARTAGEPLPAVPGAAGGAAPDTPAARAVGSFGSFRVAGNSGSFHSSGSGSGGAGYGLALIAPDPESQERIRRIMQSLCEKDAKRGHRT